MEDFSVLMSVYAKDNPLWLKEALDSVLTQTITPKEVLLVCDGPLTPSLENVLTEYKDKLTLHRLTKNSGLGEALRQGVEKCSCELIARMDSDDICVNNRFELQLKEFEKDKDLAICGGYIQEITEDKQPLSIRKAPLEQKEIKNYLKFRNPFNHMSVMFKKSAVLDSGNYQSFHFLEDYYLWARMSAKNKKMKNISNILINARTGKGMIARRGGLKYFKSNKALYKEFYKMGILNLREYLYILTVRFIVQVLMTAKMREMFYKKALR